MGAEDGAINIFNNGEWGNISNRFPIRGSIGKRRGQCSVDNLEVLSENHTIVGCSDGKIKILSMFPNKVVCEREGHRSSVESVAISKSKDRVATTSDNTIFIHEFKECEESEEIVQKAAKSNFFSDL